MRDRRVLKDSVPEIEDVRAAGERVKDLLNGAVQRPTTSDERERVEIALDRKRVGQLLRGPGGINGLVEANRIDAGLERISD